MNNQPAISVIIPMYNTEKYVSACLDSILAQSFQDFEVIVVDDYSTDNSVKIIESYFEKFEGKLKLFKLKENSGGGGGFPRNKGFNFSRGEYVFFMDSDDLITNNALEVFYTLAKKFDAEVVYTERNFVMDEDGKNVRVTTHQRGGFVEEPTLETSDIEFRIQSICDERTWVTPWQKFIRRDFIIENDINFPNIRPGEDDIWTYALVLHSKNFLRIPNIVYTRRLSNGSVMRTIRTFKNYLDFWYNPIILGMKFLEKLTYKIDSLKDNYELRWKLLRHFSQSKIERLFNDRRGTPPNLIYKFDVYKKNLLKEYDNSAGVNESLSKYVYENVVESFGKYLKEYDVLVATLLTIIDEQQRELFETFKINDNAVDRNFKNDK